MLDTNEHFAANEHVEAHPPAGSTPSSSTDTAAFLAPYEQVMLDPIFREFFGGTGHYNVGWAERPLPQADASRALVRRLCDFIASPPRTALDAGCGLGGATHELCALWPSAEIVGINISSRQLEHCRKTVRGAEFLEMDATRLAFEGKRFDVVFCLEAALHFDTRERFLAEAARVLAPDGHLVMSDIIAIDDEWPGAWSVPHANRNVDLAGYPALLRGAGFTEVRVEDATEPCWTAYTRRLKDYFDSLLGLSPALDVWRRVTTALDQAKPPTYLLVSARKAASRS